MHFGKTDRGLEWRDGLGCYWLAGLLLIAVAWGWLTSVGVPQDLMNWVGLTALAALSVLFVLGARDAKPPTS
jgi:hypothetical protein